MDSPEPQSQGGDAETSGQKQARLRRERREAKIKAGGSARLEKITNVSGRERLPGTLYYDLEYEQRADKIIKEPPPVAASLSPSVSHADPDEVDLSTHPSAARTPNTDTNGGPNNTVPTEADIRALLRSGAPQPGNDKEQQEDPMIKLLQQMMGGMPPPGGGDGEGLPSEGMDGGLPPGLAAMLGGGASTPETKADTYGYLWRIVHAVFAFILGIYITTTSHAFTGDISRGGVTGVGHEGGVNAFWVFATTELLLQGSRFFLEEKGAGGPVGWMGMVVGALPPPWKGYVMLASRYAGMVGRVVEDGMVVVFVVGAVAWWRGQVG